MAKSLAVISGIVLLVLGILGFIANPLFGGVGLFATNGLLNAIYLALGIILILIGLASPLQAELWMVAAGAMLLILSVLGFVMTPAGGSILGIVTVSAPDNWLHLALGIVLVAMGLAQQDREMLMPASPQLT